MRWSSFKYLFRQGLHSMLANRMMTLASLGVLLVCMLLTGFTGLLSANVNSLMEWLGGENEMVVMLDRSATDTEYEVTGAQIRSIDGVAEAIYTSKQEALDQLSGDMGEYAYLFNELAGEENPLYAQYTVRVSDPARMEEIANEIRSLDCVEMVNSPDGLVKTFLNVQKWVQIISWGLVTVLGVVSAVVISNTIRLTVFARRKEINIMKFVGATNSFIRMPFFVEGMTVGVVAGLLASGLVLGGYHLVLQKAAAYFAGWEEVVTAVLLPVQAVWPWVTGGFVVFGLVLGGIGTIVSMRRYLDV